MDQTAVFGDATMRRLVLPETGFYGCW